MNQHTLRYRILYIHNLKQIIKNRKFQQQKKSIFQIWISTSFTNPRMIEAVFTSQTLMGLISDAKSFESITDDYFQILDLDKDGMLSPSELRQGLNRVVAVESEVASGEETDSVYNSIFEKFGEKLSPEKFRDLMAEILTAMARAFGNTPVIMVVHNDGLIMKAVHHESKQGK